MLEGDSLNLGYLCIFFFFISDEEQLDLSNEDHHEAVPVVGVNRELDFSNQVIVPLTCQKKFLPLG